MKSTLDLKSLKKQLQKFLKTESKHLVFLGIILVLLAYVYVVWNISKLAVAEPSQSDSAVAETQIPKIDKKAINQIQSLEQNSKDIHSLFDSARNNPFQE